MNAHWFFGLWRKTRNVRKEILSGCSGDFRHIGVSELARILKTNPNCDLDGDVLQEGPVSRYFDMRLGIIEVAGTVYI